MYKTSKQPGRQNSQVLADGVDSDSVVSAGSEVYRGFALGPIGGEKPVTIMVEQVLGGAAFECVVHGRFIRKDGTKSAAIQLGAAISVGASASAFSTPGSPVCDEYAIRCSVAGGTAGTYNAWICL